VPRSFLRHEAHRYLECDKPGLVVAAPGRAVNNVVNSKLPEYSVQKSRGGQSMFRINRPSRRILFGRRENVSKAF